MELLDQLGDESLPLWRGKLIGHSARLRGCRCLEDTLYCHGEQLVLDCLPLHVANDVEVVAQVTATEIQDLTFLGLQSCRCPAPWGSVHARRGTP